MTLKSIILSLKIFFGYELCPQCGSDNIKKCGFEGVNFRYSCKDCGGTTYIW